MNNSPIGVYDSGFGGLSVWREIHRRLPEESLLYLGDGKNCPYGGRSREEITAFAREAVERLIGEGVKMVVVGCNTATTAAVDALRAEWPDIPIVGLEPAVKPACLSSRTRRIAVLATAHSLQSDMFLNTARRYAADVEVIKVEGRGFVELVESDRESTDEAVRVVKEAIRPMLERGADRIVLGCTHYPFLRGALERAAEGTAVRFIDPSEAVARRVRQLLDEHHLAAEQGHSATVRYDTFADETYRLRLQRKLTIRH